MDPPESCAITPTPLSSFPSAPTDFVPNGGVTIIKVPVVVAEPTIQISIEATIDLRAPATEIKQVKKSVFLDQVKLVPVAPFTRIGTTDFFEVTRAKLFVGGHIRKDIQFTTAGAVAGTCLTNLLDRVVDVPFTGFTDVAFASVNRPIIGISETAEANFLNETNPLAPRLDKYYFNNLVKFNEQPYGELVAANFFELDFSPTITTPEGAFTSITEKLVLELTLKVLQLQQVTLSGSVALVPLLTGLIPPPTP
ncbi:CsxC family protein [Bacillus massiliigorillae]|uniref:CsxC family protein n=1 Tax=Bacillus massiliigorillae TaxID=1243664 RepID=UPI003F6D02DC